MVTSAGRLRKNTSQGWPSSSASRTRPIRMPSATPTRHRDDEARRHPQERDREVPGQLAGGACRRRSWPAPRRAAASAADCRRAWPRAATGPPAPAATGPGSATRRSRAAAPRRRGRRSGRLADGGEAAGHGAQKLTFGQKVPGASSWLVPTSFSPPSSARTAIELGRLGLLLRAPMLDDALAVAAHEGRRARPRSRPRVTGIRRCHSASLVRMISLAAREARANASTRSACGVGPALLEDVAQLRHAGRHAQRLLHLADADQPPVALRLQARAEMPVVRARHRARRSSASRSAAAARRRPARPRRRGPGPPAAWRRPAASASPCRAARRRCRSSCP